MRYYNPIDKFYKSTVGAVRVGETITFRVKGDFNSVFFVMHEDGSNVDDIRKLTKCNDFFELKTKFDKSGLFFYRFKADDKFICLGADFCGELSYASNDFQLTVYDKDFFVPDWLKGGIIYQIFPDRFNCSEKEKKISKNKVLHKSKEENPDYLPNEKGEVLNNDFYGGDLLGIEKKLTYLKSLGVTAIYLNPIFKAFSNHRYDVGDYMKIDSLLGTEVDLKNLIYAADQLGIKIILDGVFNHTGSDSVYFNKKHSYNTLGAYQSENSPYYEWYKFIKFPKKYESWWGIHTLPAVNKNSESFVQFITGENGVIEHYTNLGIGGWRLDVVDELPSEFVQKIRKAVKSIDKNAIIIGEVWEDASNKISYDKRRKYFQGKELDSVMNYPLKDAIISFVCNGCSNVLSYTVKSLVDHYPKDVLNVMMNILSTHDTVRILSALSNVRYENMTNEEKSKIILNDIQVALAKKRLKIASLLQFTLNGVPSIYYGDEAGMQGFFDPYNRKFFPWGNEDSEITEYYKKLAEIRAKYSAFKDGDFDEVCAQGGIYAFTRKNDESEVLVVTNCGKKEGVIDINEPVYDVLTGNKYCGLIKINTYEAFVFIKKD